MKIKRLLSLMLCLAMLATVALTTGCEKTTEENQDGTGSSDTEVVEEGGSVLSMYIVTEDETDEEQAKAVQLAINEITLKKLDIKVKINYVKADDFASTVEQAMIDVDRNELIQKIEEQQKNKEEKLEAEEGAAEEEAPEEAEEEESLDEALDQLLSDGDIILEEPQLDIIVFNDFMMFKEYAEQTRLVDLTEYLNLSSKQLYSYIYPAYMDAVKLNREEIYGIPVNGPIGNYEYFVFDMELANKYRFDVTSVKSFTDLEKYLAIIKANEPDVVPLNKVTTLAGFEFWPKPGSPIAAYRSNELYDFTDTLFYTYEDEGFLNHYRAINRYRKAGYIGSEDDPEGTRYAVQIREGSSTAPERWEEQDGRDYECIVYKVPTFTNEDSLSSIYSIYSKCTNKAKAMQFITLLQTNSELANLLQWGIEGVHYDLVDKDDGMGTITLRNDCGYYMNSDYTGNKYIKYRLATEPYEFELQKQQNLNVLIGAFAGFNPLITDEDARTLELGLEVTDQYYADLIGGYGDFDEIIAAINDGLKDLYEDSTYIRFVTSKFGGPLYMHHLTLEEKYLGTEEGAEEGVEEGTEEGTEEGEEATEDAEASETEETAE